MTKSLWVALIFCEISRSISGTGRLQKDNSYYAQIHKVLVLVQALCVKGFVAPVNWRHRRVTGVGNYKAVAESDLLLLQACVPAYLPLMDCQPISTSQDNWAMHFTSHCSPGTNLLSLLIKWCRWGKGKWVFCNPIRPSTSFRHLCLSPLKPRAPA